MDKKRPPPQSDGPENHRRVIFRSIGDGSDRGGTSRQNCVDLPVHGHHDPAERWVGLRQGESMPEPTETMRTVTGANRSPVLIRTEMQKRPTRQR